MPRTETIEKTYYQFDELSDDAQEKAIEAYRETNLEGYDWWEYVYEDATTIADLMGITIDKIYFSGFWSQGDGACFEGSYSYKKRSVREVRRYAPQDDDLQEIALALYKIQRKNFFQLYANVKHSGHYYHEMCTSIDVGRESDNYQELSEDAESDVTELLRSFMQWIYSRLNAEHDWMQADAQIEESIKANEYEFDEHGTMV